MSHFVTLTLLGTAQDAGLPQAGCGCERCALAHADSSKIRFPVSLGIRGLDGSNHLIEVTRRLPSQLSEWSLSLGEKVSIIPDSVTFTHLHLGHIEGIGQFGKPVMAMKDLPIYSTRKNIDYLEKRIDFKLMVDDGNFNPIGIEFNQPFKPTEECGFTLELIEIPHRNECGDTAGIIIRGIHNSLLYLPDHDTWGETLIKTNSKNIREFFEKIQINEAWIDGTFWNGEELSNRDMSKIPHPTIEESLMRLQKKESNDIKVKFIHFNHTNPVCDERSEERKQIESMGWGVGQRGDVVKL
ncbi:MAG: hypothetical protein HN534_00325 [Euryarchaeota archaeon]|jgi:pyrroloquinoline quinone biosynthesis protein B|nr:hypothetical protein [Euryarchaeota archaeon]MBT3653367.1 hypothetical protein [Euryarchaeota archaeon]MBT3758235.1 hypothetical protein [Euryarchaeota archaeon]MBT4051344.1 hypothetical protein [Euryarchaeota archaeon]MBT4346668.1 hypothetical protein [Euryarchaeota archaeon]